MVVVNAQNATIKAQADTKGSVSCCLLKKQKLSSILMRKEDCPLGYH